MRGGTGMTAVWAGKIALFAWFLRSRLRTGYDGLSSLRVTMKRQFMWEEVHHDAGTRTTRTR